MITYTNDLSAITEDMLRSFFDGWPNPPSPAAHMRILQGSYLVWLALDAEENRVVGFINAISDGIFSAYIPLLEVLPAYKNQGIGAELVRRTLASLQHLYMVDLLCDEPLQDYYKRFDMYKATGMMVRNYARQNCE